MKSVSFIRDTGFSDGFLIHGATHEEGIIGKAGKAVNNPHWTVAQWGDYKHPLTDGSLHSETVDVSLTGNNTIRLEILSSNEYCGHLRQDGEDWPHLLIEQSFDSSMPSMKEISSLIFTCDFKLDYCFSVFPKEMQDPLLHAAQVHEFFTLSDPASGAFIWFGVPFFDSRYEIFPGYLGIDRGKADASGMLILIEKQEKFTSQSSHSENWISYNCDILPMMKSALETAKSEGLFANCDFSNMKLTSTNVGWEMFSQYDGAFQLKNLSLTANLT